MPTATYENLLAETAPARIETSHQFEAYRARLGDLMRKNRMSRAEERLFDLLTVLIEDYDRRNRLPPSESSVAERLRFLMEHSGRKPADLVPVFSQRSHVNEALNGKRKISAEQARKLGALFSVDAGLFI